MLTAWIPLAAYDNSMGALMIMDGSHLWPGTEWMATFNEQSLDQLEGRIRAQGMRPEVVPISIRPGQVSFHHARTVHGSAPNRGKRPRIALTVHFQDGANAYRRHVDGRGKEALHMNDVLCRKDPAGLPDYADPDICPVLWRGK